MASLDWVVKDGFLEEVPLELKRKKRSSSYKYVFDSS